MQIVISEDEIRKIVAEETEKAVRKRIKEMQGDYTSKGYLEEMISRVLWDTITSKIPSIEEYLENKIDSIIEIEKQNIGKVSRKEVIERIADAIIYELGCNEE